MIDRRTMLSLGSGAAVVLIAARAEAQPRPPAGNVTALTGKASALADGAGERTLARGDPVQLAEMVQTAAQSRLGLQLGQRTIVNLGPSTKLKLDPHIVDAGGTFDLVEGSMLFEHTRPKGTAPGRAEIRSPYGLIAVRGTRFWAGINRGVFGVFVVDGQVDVSASGRTVSLAPGWGSDIAHPGAAPTQARAWPVPRQREIYMETLGFIPRR